MRNDLESLALLRKICQLVIERFYFSLSAEWIDYIAEAIKSKHSGTTLSPWMEWVVWGQMGWGGGGVAYGGSWWVAGVISGLR